MRSLKHTPLYVGLAVGIVIGLLFAGSSLGAPLPWAIVLLCPVMMLLMMRGMGHHGAGQEGRDHEASTLRRRGK
jgi:peptidoglycan/LPS O-acetylase OafA/YrhL